MDDSTQREGKFIDRLRALERENRELKRLASNLTEAATKTRDRELSWVYALEGNRDGVWDWNAITNEVFFSKRWKEMLGFEEDEIAGRLDEWDSRIHPEDRAAVYADLDAHMTGATPYYENEHRLRCKDGSYRWILDRGRIISWTDDGKPLRVVGTHSDVHEKKLVELENARLVQSLQEALENVKVLKGLVPICAWCKKIRDDSGFWSELEAYISQHSEAQFSHGICPECRNREVA